MRRLGRCRQSAERSPHFNTGDAGVDRMSIATNATAIAVNRNQSSMTPFNIGIL